MEVPEPRTVIFREARGMHEEAESSKLNVETQHVTAYRRPLIAIQKIAKGCCCPTAAEQGDGKS
jgi:hypothetical protein